MSNQAIATNFGKEVDGDGVRPLAVSPSSAPLHRLSELKTRGIPDLTAGDAADIGRLVDDPTGGCDVSRATPWARRGLPHFDFHWFSVRLSTSAIVTGGSPVSAE